MKIIALIYLLAVSSYSFGQNPKIFHQEYGRGNGCWAPRYRDDIFLILEKDSTFEMHVFTEEISFSTKKYKKAIKRIGTFYMTDNVIHLNCIADSIFSSLRWYLKDNALRESSGLVAPFFASTKKELQVFQRKYSGLLKLPKVPTVQVSDTTGNAMKICNLFRLAFQSTAILPLYSRYTQL